MNNDDVTPVRCGLFSEAERLAAHFAAKTAELSKPGTQRTQEAADKRWPMVPGDRRFQVWFTSDRNNKKITDHAFKPTWVWARDEDEAKMRYQQIQGLTAWDTSDRYNPRMVILQVADADGVAESTATPKLADSRDRVLDAQGVGGVETF